MTMTTDCSLPNIKRVATDRNFSVPGKLLVTSRVGLVLEPDHVTLAGIGPYGLANHETGGVSLCRWWDRADHSAKVSLGSRGLVKAKQIKMCH